jgi:hypothetical protein
MEVHLDPSLLNVLRNHESRITKVERRSIGCENSDDFFVVVDEPPEDPVCGVCYIVIGTDECSVNCDAEAPTCGCFADVMGSEEWTKASADPSDDLMLWDATNQWYRGNSANWNTMVWPDQDMQPRSVKVLVENMGYRNVVERFPAFPDYGTTDSVVIFMGYPPEADEPDWFRNAGVHVQLTRSYLTSYQLYIDEPGVATVVVGDLGVATTVHDFTFEVQLDPDGHLRTYFDGALVHEGVVTSIPDPTRVGVAIDSGSWLDHFDVDSPRITDICITSVACMFCDHFERADGALGDDWVAGPSELNGYPHADQVIVSGAAEVPFVPGGAIGNMVRAVPVTGDQFIEVAAANLWQEMAAIGNGGLVVETEWILSCRGTAGGTDESFLGAYIFPYTGTRTSAGPSADREDWEGEISVDLIKSSATGSWNFFASGIVEPFYPWRDNPAVTFRLESDDDGATRFYVDGALVCSGTCPGGLPTGDRIGWAPVWYHTFYGGITEPLGEAVQTLSVCTSDVGGGGGGAGDWGDGMSAEDWRSGAGSGGFYGPRDPVGYTPLEVLRATH